jgi:hypothetical protein
MKTLALLTLAVAVSGVAQTKNHTKKKVADPAAAVAPAARQAPPDVTIPKGAVEEADGNFHYTDPQGKKWLYRKTPFGVAKSEDKPTPASLAPPQQDTLTVATDAGDSVHFEKPSPFGTVKWDKKKTDLDANEQSVWNRQKK